jgi:sialate O-acetylesterase
MIAPLGNFGFRGVVWYQGESNTGEATEYQVLLTALMSDWRGKFGAALPFLVVQLPNYGPPSSAPYESAWARLRESQRLAVAADGNSALAIAIDIGDRHDLHPPNKQELGSRLARAARHLVYHEAVTPSGPVPLRATRRGERVRIAFGDVDGMLISYSSAQASGFELCGVAAHSCSYATALIEGREVSLQVSSDSSPVRVRFCWADSPVCTLYDSGSGLPAGPFEIPID